MDTIILTARPVTVEARHFETPDQAADLALWCKGWTGGSPEQPRVRMYTDTGDVGTAELGDWVLRTATGHYYPAPHAVVDAKYDRPVSAAR